MSKFFKTFLSKFKLPAAAAAWKGWIRMPRAHQKRINNQVQPLIHSKAPEQRRAKKSPSGRPEVTKSNNQRICPYCFASQTPQWRSSTKGPHLCNACGLYEERCGVERPLSMIIRKRAEAKGRNFR